jgi:hypothetical protein
MCVLMSCGSSGWTSIAPLISRKPARGGDLYDLLLINMEKGRGQRDWLCDDLCSATPPQRLAFLVGQPQYLPDSPNADQRKQQKV